MQEITTELLTIREVAHIFRVDGTTVRRWIYTGALPAVYLPHAHSRAAYRIKRETVDAILAGTGKPMEA